MDLFYVIAITFLAGMGAGLGTGFAGMSAAAVISPVLIKFLNMDPYMAVGIALSSDVLASAVSAYTYGKNKNLDIKNGSIMMVSVLIFTVIGSYVASLLPSATMGNFAVDLLALVEHLTAGGGQDAHDGPADGGLARAGLAHQTEGLALIDGKVCVLDGLVGFAAGAVSHLEVFHLEQYFAFVCHVT